MFGKHIAVFGVYHTSGATEAALGALKSTGFRRTDVSILHPLDVGVTRNGTGSSPASGDRIAAESHGGLPERGYADWLAGVERLTIPGMGPCIGAGPIVGALAGMGTGGSLGRAGDALVGLGLGVGEAVQYEDRVREGCILLSVHADNFEWAGKAREILRRSAAEDIFATADAGNRSEEESRRVSPFSAR